MRYETSIFRNLYYLSGKGLLSPGKIPWVYFKLENYVGNKSFAILAIL